jgi:hypothetical protein
MVRRLGRKDLQLLDTFLRRSLPDSFPILGEIERAGQPAEARELWGWFAKNELRAVLAHTPTAAYVCGTEKSAVEELSGVLAGFRGLAEIDGSLEAVAPYAGKVSLAAAHRQYLAYLSAGSFTPRYVRALRVKRATVGDATSIAALWCRTLTVADRSRTAEHLRSRLSSPTDRIYLGWSSGLLVTTASTSHESPSLACIRCTYTDPDLREAGLATACLSTLCQDLLSEGKTVVVLTETLTDARIYRNVGFMPAGLWAECKR